MKTIYALIILLALALVSCDNTRREISPVLHEKVVVVALIYSPAEHNKETVRIIKNDTLKDGTKYKSDSTYSTTTTIPAVYGVAFQCQHGTFTIQGTEAKHKVLYQKLSNSLHDTVDVLYKEEYLVTYDKDVPTKVVSKVLDKLDFVDAQILPQK